MPRLLQRLCLLALLAALPLHAAELTVDLGHGPRSYTTAQLLARSDATDVSIPDDVAFRHAMRYRAVRLKALLAGAGKDDTLQFVASDGFAAQLPAKLLLATGGAQAWLAIEDPAHPWPALPGGKGDAGPFYVVWTHPEASKVGPEQWPYQLASIHRQASPAQRFPAVVPDAGAGDAVQRGFVVFQHTCFACHTLNGQGDARLGPDLNIPHNPTQYLRDDLLRAYIRDPQSLRRWPQARMPGFDRKAISDEELDDLLAYLRHMATRQSQP